MCCVGSKQLDYSIFFFYYVQCVRLYLFFFRFLIDDDERKMISVIPRGTYLSVCLSVSPQLYGGDVIFLAAIIADKQLQFSVRIQITVLSS